MAEALSDLDFTSPNNAFSQPIQNGNTKDSSITSVHTPQVFGRSIFSRSKNGCKTCRERKVKCNEARPVCSHCHRLHLSCLYDPVRPRRKYRRQKRKGDKTIPISQDRVSRDDIDTNVNEGASLHRIEEPTTCKPNTGALFKAILKSVNNCGPDNNLIRSILPYPSNISSEPNLIDQPQEYIETIDPLGPNLFREDSIWTNIPMFATSAKAPAGDFSQISASLQAPQAQLLTTNSISIQDSQNQAFSPSIQDSSPTSWSDIPPAEFMLLKHFLDFAIPPLLICIEPRWDGARKSLLKLTKSNNIVRHSICAFSALSLVKSSSLDGDLFENQTSNFYYELALEELEGLLSQISSWTTIDTEGSENILASIFFLAYVELMMSSQPQKSPELLQRAHSISVRDSVSWSQLGLQLQVWLKLLDAKVISAGGDGIHLLATPDIHATVGTNHECEIDPRGKVEAIEFKINLQETGDILFNALNSPAYDFYLQTIQFSGRIARLDIWHRSRGTVSDETEVMIEAEKIESNLKDLWQRRPAIIDLTNQATPLRQYLSEGLALKLEAHLRTYCANFYACFIHLQRVAHSHLPSSPLVHLSIKKILHLVKLAAIPSPSNIPSSMLWPLMMIGCEVKDDTARNWIINCMEEMKFEVGNAARTARLVREITNRQKNSGRRADARTVMHETFGTIFAIM